MSAATEQNNGDVAVEKVAADAVKEDLKSQKAAVEDGKPVAADNGTASKDEVHDDDTAPAKEHVKGTKRPADVSIFTTFFLINYFANANSCKYVSMYVCILKYTLIYRHIHLYIHTNISMYSTISSVEKTNQ